MDEVRGGEEFGSLRANDFPLRAHDSTVLGV